MEAIFLVGGLGTRLGQLTAEIPKPMLPIRGAPFLECLLRWAKSQGVDKATLAVGFKHEVITKYFSSHSGGLPLLQYSLENSPLGTGGALRKALSKTNSENILLLNGDTYADVNLTDLLEKHVHGQPAITLSSLWAQNIDRYSYLETTGEIVSNFGFKGHQSGGFINAGVSVLNRSIIQRILENFSCETFSFEDDLLAPLSKKKKSLSTTIVVIIF